MLQSFQNCHKVVLDSSPTYTGWQEVWCKYFVEVAITPWSTGWMSDKIFGGRCTPLMVGWSQSWIRGGLEHCWAAKECWMGLPSPSNISVPLELSGGKTSPENGLCTSGFGDTLPHNRKRGLGYVFKGPLVVWKINREASTSYYQKHCHKQ